MSANFSKDGDEALHSVNGTDVSTHVYAAEVIPCAMKRVVVEQGMIRVNLK